MDSFSFSHTGGRSCNEDRVGSKDALFVVADGLGGHRHGAQASACAVETILASYDPSREEPLLFCLERANQEILALQARAQSNMRSTAVCLALTGDNARWAHVGDSRLYHFRDGRLLHCTADHSVAYAKYRAGEIARWEIPQDEDQSSLLRSLGNPSRSQGEAGGAATAPGDGFLLCSDGVWEYLHDQEIAADLLKTATARDWAEALLLRVMERAPQGNDNLSLITVRLE